MMIETRCFNVIIWGRITAVGHIGQKVIVLGIVAPPPPPAVWREDNRMKPIPSHSTRSAVAWMIWVLIILIMQLQPAVQFTLTGGAIDPLLARSKPPVGVGHRPTLSPLWAAEPALLDYRPVFGVLQRGCVRDIESAMCAVQPKDRAARIYRARSAPVAGISPLGLDR